MKRSRIFTVILAALTAMMLLFAGCSPKEGLVMQINDDNTATITAETSDEGDFVSAGALVVKKGQKVTVEPAADTSGKIELKLLTTTDAGQDASLDEVLDGEEALVETVDGTEAQTFEAAPGEYQVVITVVEPFVGSMTIHVE